MNIEAEKLEQLCQQVKGIAVGAGKRILDIYYNEPVKNWDVQQKADSTPLTRADTASHHFIVNALMVIEPTIPIISEEGVPSFAQRKAWELCWVIDPLDGTKEFLAQNGEFTVNIALVYQGQPILGVIYAPVLDELYWSHQFSGSYKHKGGIDELIRVAPLFSPQPIRLMASRHHGSTVDATYTRWLREPNNIQTITLGSSLKFCNIAQGMADVYIRLGPTSEWDTAAGQIILVQAGGHLVSMQNEPFTYNKRSTLLNTSFIAMSNKSLVVM